MSQNDLRGFWFKIYQNPVGILVFGVVVSVIVFFAIKHWQENNIEREFQYKAKGHASAIQAEFQYIEARVKGVRRQIAYHINVEYDNPDNPDAFMPMAGSILSNDPQLLNIQWGVIEQSKLQSGKSSRLKLLYSDKKAHIKVVDNDLGSNGFYTKHIGLITTPEGIHAFINHENHGQINEMTFIAPVSNRVQDREGSASRQIGALIVDWDVDGLIERALKKVPVSGQDISLFTVQSDGNKFLVYRHISRSRTAAEDNKKTDFRYHINFEFSGLHWQIEFVAAPAFMRDHPLLLAWESLFFCLLITGLIAWNVRYLIRQNKTVEALVRVRTNALIKSEKNYYKLIEQAPKANCIHKKGKWVYLNPVAMACFGASLPEDVLGKPVLDFVHLDDHAIVTAFMEAHHENKSLLSKIEVHLQRLDGVVFDAEIVQISLLYGGKMVSMLTVRDISKHKQAELQRHILAQTVKQAGESIVVTDNYGIITYVNPAFSRVSGYSEAEGIGMPVQKLHGDDEDMSVYQNMRKCILAGEVWRGSVVSKRKDGVLYPATLNVAPIMDDSGVVIYFVGIETDLSYQENLERQFYQAQKMEEIGTLVGGIAHDFNNMLASLMGNLYLAKKNTATPPDVLKRLHIMDEVSHRAADMIAQLLVFSRKGTVQRKEFPLVPLIKESMGFLRSAIPENISFQQEICKNTLPVKADATQIHQVLMNLVNNARDAVENSDNPYIHIQLEQFDTDEAFLKTHTYFRAGSYAHLRVSDNGCGISEYQKKKIYEPFFTTKGVGKGTGLGLSMVFGSIKSSDGFVDMDSIEGEGSTFHVYLPLLEQQVIASSSVQDETSRHGNGELILIVDDNEALCDINAEMLESIGYRVISANDGDEALTLFNARREDIAIAIFDVVMPKMGGVKLAEHIWSIKTDFPIVFMTGYDEKGLANEKKERKPMTVLSKPVDFHELSLNLYKRLNFPSDYDHI